MNKRDMIKAIRAAGGRVSSASRRSREDLEAVLAQVQSADLRARVERRKMIDALAPRVGPSAVQDMLSECGWVAANALPAFGAVLRQVREIKAEVTKIDALRSLAKRQEVLADGHPVDNADIDTAIDELLAMIRAIGLPRVSLPSVRDLTAAIAEQGEGE